MKTNRKMKRIKNKVIHKTLRIIANWDNCPNEYKRNFSAEFEKILFIIGLSFWGMISFLILMINFS